MTALGPDPRRWPEAWREVFEEKAALFEFGDGLDRRAAEDLAENLTREMERQRSRGAA